MADFTEKDEIEIQLKARAYAAGKGETWPAPEANLRIEGSRASDGALSARAIWTYWDRRKEDVRQTSIVVTRTFVPATKGFAWDIRDSLD